MTKRIDKQVLIIERDKLAKEVAGIQADIAEADKYIGELDGK